MKVDTAGNNIVNPPEKTILVLFFDSSRSYADRE
jgi:hypothetical protein